jgi:hypothetical protein
MKDWLGGSEPLGTDAGFGEGDDGFRIDEIDKGVADASIISVKRGGIYLHRF